MRFTVALLQIAPAHGDQGSNLAKGIRYCKEAKSRGADLAVFPELWNIGFAPCPLDAAARTAWEAAAIDRESVFLEKFAQAARELDLNIAVTYLERRAGKPRNTVSIINADGDVALNYSKTFICDFGANDTERGSGPDVIEVGCDHACEPGDTFEVCTLAGAQGKVQVGAMICSDREFPEPATELMMAGAEVIVVPNACTWDHLRSTLLQARAFENMVAIASTNYPAPKANGHSQAWSGAAWRNGIPARMQIAEADERETIVLAEIDIRAIREFRSEESWRMRHRRRYYGKLRIR